MLHGFRVLPEGGSDFNDMHQAHGLQTVRVQVSEAVELMRESKNTGAAQKAVKQSTSATGKPAGAVASGAGGRGADRKSRGGHDEGPSQGATSAPSWEDPFTQDEAGVW